MVSGIGGLGNIVGSMFGGLDQMQQARGQQKQTDPEMLKKLLEDLLAGASDGQGGGGADGDASARGPKINMPEMNKGQVNFM